MAAKKKYDRTKQKETLVKVLEYIKHYRAVLVFSLILAAVTVACTLYLPILTGDAINLILSPGQVDFNGIKPILYKGAAVIIIGAAAQWIMNICNNRITYAVVRDIRQEAFEKIERLPLKYIDSHPYGDIVSRIIADADQFSDGLLMGFTQLFTGIVTILGTLFFLFMTFASFSTVLAVFENLLAFAVDTFGISRKKASLIGCIAMLVLSMPCILGFNVWGDLQLIGARGVQDSEDFLVSNLLLPIGAVVYLLFCVSRWGWGFENYLAEANTGKGPKLPRWLRPYFRYVLPLLIIVILVQGLL